MQHLFPRMEKNLHLLYFTHLLTLSLWGIIKSLVYTFTLMRSSVRGDLFVLVQARPSRQYVPDDLLKALNSLNSLYAAVLQAASAQRLHTVLPVLRALVTNCTLQSRLSQVTEGIWWNTMCPSFFLSFHCSFLFPSFSACSREGRIGVIQTGIIIDIRF